MFIKKLLKKILYKEKANSETYVLYLRKIGCSIGDGSVIYAPTKTVIDITRPWLINIGKNVQITEGVTILTHGYDWSVLKGVYGEILGSSGKVTIGNNVFIGMKTTVLKGVTIGNNVIIGANSLVNKDIPDNVVVAGNPAKVIMSIDEYYKKRQKRQLDEAVESCVEYYKRYNEWPRKKFMREFVWLFESRDINVDSDEVFSEIGKLVGNYETTKKHFYKTRGQFKNYDEFLEYCKRKI